MARRTESGREPVPTGFRWFCITILAVGLPFSTFIILIKRKVKNQSR